MPSRWTTKIARGFFYKHENGKERKTKEKKKEELN
jgi:hypothetical protein